MLFVPILTSWDGVSGFLLKHVLLNNHALALLEPLLCSRVCLPNNLLGDSSSQDQDRRGLKILISVPCKSIVFIRMVILELDVPMFNLIIGWWGQDSQVLANDEASTIFLSPSSLEDSVMSF